MIDRTRAAVTLTYDDATNYTVGLATWATKTGWRQQPIQNEDNDHFWIDLVEDMEDGEQIVRARVQTWKVEVKS
jgi:hypothetical protein